ncbi:MAG: hypothetical protein Ta2A_10110 [Treponemataceae bacterium]|nr:MAG: hypothetical protein Ta2A_10110 [Treponemataceae bacterium]
MEKQDKLDIGQGIPDFSESVNIQSRIDGYVFGRPTKYKKRYCKEALYFLAQGKNITQLAAHFLVAKPTIYEWAKAHPDFSTSIHVGKELSAAYWVDYADAVAQGLYSSSDAKPIYQILALTLKNKGGYVEKIEQKISGEVTQHLSYEERLKNLGEDEIEAVKRRNRELGIEE